MAGRRVPPPLELRAGSSAALPWPDGSFDTVYAVHTIYFWDDPAKHLSEIHRVLAPGGRAVLGFRERNTMTEKALPAEVYNLRSMQEVADLLRNVGFVPKIDSENELGLWIVEGSRR